VLQKVPLQNDFLRCAGCSVLKSPSLFCPELIIRQTEGGGDWICCLDILKGYQFPFTWTKFCSLLLNPTYLGGKMHNTVPFIFQDQAFLSLMMGPEAATGKV